jgi:branched-chain amino acid transport system substrate-binding protein
MSEEKVYRRHFLKYAVTGIVCGIVAGVGGYFSGAAVAPQVKTVTKTISVAGPTVTTTVPGPTVTETITTTHTVPGPTVTTTVTKTVTPEPPRTIKIGIGMQLSGRFAAPYGENVDAAYVWQDVVNAKGGIYVAEYNTTLPVEIILYDTESKPEVAGKVFERLVTVDKVDFLLGPFGSTEAFPASLVAEKYKTPLINWAATSLKIYGRGNKYVFSTQPVATSYTDNFFEALANWEKLELKPPPKTIAILYEDMFFTRDIAKGARERAAGLDLDIIWDETFPPGTMNFIPLLSKVKAANPDILFIASYSDSGATILKQMRELDYSPKIVFGSEWTDVPAMIGEMAEYAWSTIWRIYYKLNYNGLSEFKRALPKRVPKEKIEKLEVSGRMLMYATCQILEQAIINAGTLDKEKVRDAIASLRIITVMGPVEFDERGINTGFKPMLSFVKDGKWVALWPITEALPTYPFPPWGKR